MASFAPPPQVAPQVLRRRFVWHDPHIDNAENQRYLHNFRGEQYEVMPFATVAETVNFLRDNASKQMPVLTSGAGGKALLALIGGMECVSSVVILCGNREYHIGWSSQYSKVKGVFTNSGDAIAQVKVIFEQAFTAGVFQTLNIMDDDPTTLTFYNELAAQLGLEPAVFFRKHYHCVTHELAIAFLAVVDKAMNARSITEDEIQLELVALAQGPSFLTCWTSAAWTTSDGTLVVPTCLVQRLVLGYTSNFFYKALNRKIATSNFRDIIHFLAAFVKGMKEHPQQQHGGTRELEGTVSLITAELVKLPQIQRTAGCKSAEEVPEQCFCAVTYHTYRGGADGLKVQWGRPVADGTQFFAKRESVNSFRLFKRTDDTACARFETVLDTPVGSLAFDTLYRGVKDGGCEKTDYTTIGKDFYWPPFSSCTKSYMFALNWSGGTSGSGSVFHILRLPASDMRRHPTVDIAASPDWGHFKDREYEVLFAPFFKGKVVKCDIIAGVYHITVLEQHSVFSCTQEEVINMVKEWKMQLNASIHKSIKEVVLALMQPWACMVIGSPGFDCIVGENLTLLVVVQPGGPGFSIGLDGDPWNVLISGALGDWVALNGRQKVYAVSPFALKICDVNTSTFTAVTPAMLNTSAKIEAWNPYATSSRNSGRISLCRFFWSRELDLQFNNKFFGCRRVPTTVFFLWLKDELPGIIGECFGKAIEKAFERWPDVVGATLGAGLTEQLSETLQKIIVRFTSHIRLVITRTAEPTMRRVIEKITPPTHPTHTVMCLGESGPMMGELWDTRNEAVQKYWESDKDLRSELDFLSIVQFATKARVTIETQNLHVPISKTIERWQSFAPFGEKCYSEALRLSLHQLGKTSIRSGWKHRFIFMCDGHNVQNDQEAFHQFLENLFDLTDVEIVFVYLTTENGDWSDRSLSRDMRHLVDAVAASREYTYTDLRGLVRMRYEEAALRYEEAARRSYEVSRCFEEANERSVPMRCLECRRELCDLNMKVEDFPGGASAATASPHARVCTQPMCTSTLSSTLCGCRHCPDYGSIRCKDCFRFGATTLDEFRDKFVEMRADDVLNPADEDIERWFAHLASGMEDEIRDIVGRTIAQL
mmetsp:Transcript_3946/g.14697  ORF Transcript_3946/g.14697 Transcript_3946/m.14697 type:complete len:1105 (+) Transcript_3946:67-3381(+)|eukprot:CAMPEP_0203894804 /NCGR_PEP_ID=MMETSP0359-20131031/37716_1 /ASSEMBLY_ACC=CAM_ASM_000338 /TAXON_ID=268821 /ORGANISM="Scrippsiella Hangoei, Strain SHTV-5" /LENGTH=1104 /DNA_ID=CAMNT_0050817181 /DNA_START=34 /DNA_END=3348 /DNA_ORIENTATION=-